MSKEHSPKEKAVYQAVLELFWEGTDLNSLTVAEITKKAGIGKGTAYEYFADKEEMIAKALFYNACEFCRQVYEEIIEEEEFRCRIRTILVKLEKEISETNCIFRLIHTFADNSAVGKKLHELGESRNEELVMVDDLIRRVIMDECKEKELPKEKLFYLVSSTISRILCFAMFLNSPCQHKEIGIDMMREMVCDSICREIDEVIHQG